MRASKITAVDFFDDLTSSYARKRFFLGFILIIALCLLFLWLIEIYFKWPIASEVLAAVITEVAAGAVVVLCFYSLYVYFIGANIAVREVAVTRPQDIGERIRELPRDVHHYMFWGRSGSFFRSVQLVELDQQSRERKRTTSIEVLLPDPSNERLVKSYRDILKALGETPVENPLLPNVIATCMTCAILSANNKHLEIRVHLSQFLPAFRLDLSDNGAILTQDDKKKSALFFSHGSDFYEMFRSAVANERGVSREVTWDKEKFSGLGLGPASCNLITMKAFNVDFGDVASIQADVAKLMEERRHRY